MRILLRLEMTVTIDLLPDEQQSKSEENLYFVSCDLCSWSKEYKRASSARKGKAAHMSYHDKANSTAKQEFDQLIGK